MLEHGKDASRTSAAAASRPATGGGTAPVASSPTMTTSTAIAAFGALAWGGSPGARAPADRPRARQSEVAVEVAPGALHEQRVAGGQHARTGQLLAPPLHAEHDEITAVGDHAGEQALAGKLGSRRHDDLGDARRARQQRVLGVVEPVLLDQRAGVVAEVARDRAGGAVGSSRSPNSHTIAIVPATSGTPTSPNSRKPKRPAPASAAASETITLTGDPVSARARIDRRARRRRAAAAAATARVRAGSPSRP